LIVTYRISLRESYWWFYTCRNDNLVPGSWTQDHGFCTAELLALRNDVGTLERRHWNRWALDICIWWRKHLQHKMVWSWFDFQAAELLVKWPNAPRSAFITHPHSGGSRSYPWRNSQGLLPDVLFGFCETLEVWNLMRAVCRWSLIRGWCIMTEHCSQISLRGKNLEQAQHSFISAHPFVRIYYESMFIFVL
jgi:hypothetical protein